MIKGGGREHSLFSKAITHAAIFVLLIDVILNYILRAQGMSPIPFAFVSLVPIVLIIAYGPKNSITIRSTVPLAALTAICTTLSYVSLGEDYLSTIIQYPLCVAAFALGFAAQQEFRHRKMLRLTLLAGGMIHVIVMGLFISGLLQPLPDDVGLYAAGGQVFTRTAFYADQNYQVIFWTFLPGLFFLKGVLPKIIAAFGSVAALTGLMLVESRSGVLVIVGTLAACSFLIVRFYGIKKALVSTILGVLAGSVYLIFFPSSVVVLEKLWETGVQQMIARTDSSGGQMSLHHRIDSITYIFEASFSPLPVGLEGAIQQTGTIPHSAPTSLLLVFGVIGLFVWFRWLVLAPVLWGLKLAKSGGGRAYDVEAVAFIALVGIVAVTLTLPSPFTKLSWVFAGLLFGGIASNRPQLSGRFSERSEVRTFRVKSKIPDSPRP